MFARCKCPKCGTELYIDRALTCQCNFCDYVFIANYDEKPDISNERYDNDGVLIRDPELYDLAKECDADPKNLELYDRLSELLNRRSKSMIGDHSNMDVRNTILNDKRNKYNFTKKDAAVYILFAVSLIFMWIVDKINLGDYTNMMIIPRIIALIIFVITLSIILAGSLRMRIKKVQNRRQ